ncbi:M23 family metallopeptidase [Candidatus Falkowbacteria bacterium]|jgi:murein DD-endopeptidase MepM/ murein hydrolase activator NlpD|nr:M23 family metallopeptidase [Candidatus Falkowbacteria bacterium]
MLLVKILIVIKNILHGLLLIIFKPIFSLVKFLFTKPLVYFYHFLFRARRNLGGGGLWQNLLKIRTVHLTVLALTFAVVTNNIISLNRTNNNLLPQGKETIAAHLARTEFSLLTEETILIEEYRHNNYQASDDYNLRDSLLNQTPLQKKDALLLVEGHDDSDLIVRSPLNEVKPNSTSQSEVPQDRDNIIQYTVQTGDTISSIANRFRLSVNTVLWANNLGAYSLIRPGDTLSILPVSGVTYTAKRGDTVNLIASRYGVEETDIFKYNDLENGLKAGQELIIPGGRKITTAVASTPSRQTSSGSVSSVIEKLVNPAKAEDSDTIMAWPTEGSRITQYYSWRHTGLDIANKTGTPLYAAEAGTVEVSGWNNGYGYNVVVNHGGGKKTRYAHASKLYVKIGDKVERGEQIAAMGSTGWSTGPHIHFEVIVNGVRQNPLNYIR